MTKLVRLMLVWLMLLAIPFQGIASAAMLSCAHAAMAAHAPAAAPASHCHDNAPQATPGMHHADTASHDSPAGEHDHDGRCSACAACCMSAAIAPLPTVAAAPPAAMLLPAAAANHRLPAVDLALPERPPRPSLA